MKPKRDRLTVEEIAEMRRLHAAGENVEVIRQKFKVCSYTIETYCGRRKGHGENSIVKIDKALADDQERKRKIQRLFKLLKPGDSIKVGVKTPKNGYAYSNMEVVGIYDTYIAVQEQGKAYTRTSISRGDVISESVVLRKVG